MSESLERLLERALQQDAEVAARRVEAYAGEPDPYKKPRVAEDELDDLDDGPDGGLDDSLGEDDRA